MPRVRYGIILLAVVVLLCAGYWFSPARQARRAGSDAWSRDFQGKWLGRMMLDARDKFNAASVARDFSRLALDPSRLVLLEPAAVRVYFVAAQGGFMSSLGYWTEGAKLTQNHPRIIFPNATSPKKLFEYADALRQGVPQEKALYDQPRRPKAPVQPGDYMDLGTLPAGTRLVFFLDADAVNSPKGRFTTIPARNPDRIEHVVTVAYQNSPYVLLAFEDLMGGGDRTFNDVVFAVQLSQATVAGLGDTSKRAAVDDLVDQAERQRIRRARLMTAATTAAVAGVPLLLWLLLRWLRRRRIAMACAAARERLEAGDARGALRRARDARRYGGSGAAQTQLAEIMVAACRQLRDAPSLEDLFRTNADAVLKDETASLMTARAQTETGRAESFHVLRQAWQEDGVAPWEWLTLEADLLMEQEKARQAESLLRQRQFSGPRDAVRLARLAELSLSTMPKEAEIQLGHALRLTPNAPEVHRSRARMLERAGRLDEAGEAWRAAAKCSGGDPFHLDHYAEHLVRRRDFAGALACWRDALAQPATDTLWLKAFFWERVTGPVCIPWKTLEPPPGPSRPLLEHLLAMPQEQFWQTDTMEQFAQSHPDFSSRPECLWLRISQALGGRREEAALAMLSMSRPDARRGFDMLEAALRQVLTYRRMQFLNPALCIVGEGSPQAWCVPLFRRMDQWAHGELAEFPRDLAALLAGADAFAELFRAVGWSHAAEILRSERPFQDLRASGKAHNSP